MRNDNTLNQVISLFLVDETKEWRYIEINSGLINKSYYVQDNNLNKRYYVLQRINKNVFGNPEILMSNINNLNDHLISKKKLNNKYAGYQILNFYKSLTCDNYYIIYQGFYWRLMDYINHMPIELIGLDSIEEAGKILGLFHAMTSDMNTNLTKQTIPYFHEFDHCFSSFQRIDCSKNIRYQSTQDFYRELSQFDYLVDLYSELKEQHKLQRSVVHNDPKISNILFDKNGKALCLIDLDTVMSGYLGNDFGDGVRTICNYNKEDESDLAKVTFSLDRFKIYSKAYLNQVKDFITKEEQSSLALFCLLIMHEQTIRFYKDYLEGDVYYRTSYPTHNLQRAKVQLELLKQMTNQFETMNKIIGQKNELLIVLKVHFYNIIFCSANFYLYNLDLQTQ